MTRADALLDYLNRRQSAETVELRRVLDVSNLSHAARTANAVLSASGDSRRVRCQHLGRRALWVLDTPASAA